MILVDTNVITELWRISPNPAVLAWVDAQAIETLYLSAVTFAKLHFGVASMPQGRRRTVDQEPLEREVLPAFTGRALPFDLDASQAYASLMARARREGQAIGMADGYMAATASPRALTVATRDVAPYLAARVKMINPWES